MTSQLIVAGIIAFLLFVAFLLLEGHGRHTHSYVTAQRADDRPKAKGMW